MSAQQSDTSRVHALWKKGYRNEGLELNRLKADYAALPDKRCTFSEHNMHIGYCAIMTVVKCSA